MSYLTPIQLSSLKKKGSIERNLFDSDEIQLLKTAKNDQEQIVEAKKTRQVRCFKIKHSMESLVKFMECLPGAKNLLAEWKNCWWRVYHYHSKMSKRPEVGGA